LYLLAGVGLVALKFAVDWLVAHEWFGQTWSLRNYLIWPNDESVRVLELTQQDAMLSIALLLISLPFIGTGVVLTFRRLRDAGLPPALVLLFFVPLVNLLMFAVLGAAPSRPTVGRAEAPPPPTAPSTPPMLREPPKPPPMRTMPPTSREEAAAEIQSLGLWRAAHARVTGPSQWKSGLIALLVTVPPMVAMVYVLTITVRSYGFSLFVGGPFALGMASVLVFGFSRPKPLGACLLVAVCAAIVVTFVVIAVALEGAGCLIMAAPIGFPLTLLGALVGYAIQSRPWLNISSGSVMMLALASLPALAVAERATEPEPALRAVRTALVINAEPAEVWQRVISFPPLPAPRELLFRFGIAYPTHATIFGEGVGAVRHCVFSTGTFVEPIEVWDEPKLLRFAVTDQPAPMREWSPYEIHPPHLEGWLVSRRGQFLLEALPDGGTRLEGTTWYTNRMWPQPYWGWWSDAIIGRIHERVLDHIESLAECATAASTPQEFRTQ
jgi:uncharacterized membrane protein YhaH (DUF805 family)